MTLPARLAAAFTALVLALGVSGCGGDDEDEPTAETPKEYPSVSASPATGGELSGAGFTMRLPANWTDITARLKAQSPGIATGGETNDKSAGFDANFNVVVTPNQVAADPPSAKDLAGVRDQALNSLTGSLKSPKVGSVISVAGSPTVHIGGVANENGSTFYLDQYWVVTKGNNFGITFAFPRGTSSADRDKISQPVLASFTLA